MPRRATPTDGRGIPEKPYFKIGEAARLCGVKPYVLRYWETEFKSVKPQKTRSQQRLYKRRDIELLLKIRHLLYDKRYTIEGARTRLRALDREPLLVQQVPDAEELLDVAPLVEALLRARLLRLQRAELGLPVAQHVGLHAHEARRLPDLEERLVRDPRRGGHRALGHSTSLSR